MKNRIWMIVIIALLMGAGATLILLQKPQRQETARITIAEQYGLAYAPLQIMKSSKLLEKQIPGIQVSWRQLGNTAAIREAMLAGEVDAGFMAIPPFLIGKDKGMTWRIASGLSESPVALVTHQSRIKSLSDFTAVDRIALPQPGSIQHILLSMAAERELGDAKKLDSLLVTLAHPDGMNALLTKKEITAHFTTPPYLSQELETPGIHQVLDGKDALGADFTFVVGVTTEAFHQKHSREYQVFVKALKEAIDFVDAKPEETAKRLAKQYQMSEAELLRLLTLPGTKFTQSVKGVDQFARFMKKHGYLNQFPNQDQIYWDNVQYE
ncbi:MAG TPA: ABC transporter substrate-binding protein [Bacillota bacterium]|nr:ABC transporter substrate-binding protein [Bacillota bacterium]